MQMHTVWRSVILALAVAIAVAAVALFVIFRWLLPPTENRAAPLPRYTIGDWQGQVAVFEGDDHYPKQVLDVHTGTLPIAEQQQIQAGIPVEDEEQLWALIEDYSG